jgi:anthranilate 1,2-dioxygenase small subunit
MSAMQADLLTRLELQALQDDYIASLDSGRLEDWPDMFVEDCLYEIIPKENEDMGLPAPLIHCDNRRMLTDRVVSLRNANIYQPVVYRHFTSAMQWHHAEDGAIAMESNYLVINTNQLGQSLVYQTGRYFDRIVRTEAGLKFKQKRVVYDTSRVQTLLAIPI